MTETRSAADRLELIGAQTIREIETSRRTLLDKLEAKAPFAVDLSGVTEADVSLIQLLISAAKSSAAIRLIQPYPEAVQQVLARSGLDAAGVTSIWTKEQ